MGGGRRGFVWDYGISFRCLSLCSIILFFFFSKIHVFERSYAWHGIAWKEWKTVAK